MGEKEWGGVESERVPNLFEKNNYAENSTLV